MQKYLNTAKVAGKKSGCGVEIDSGEGRRVQGIGKRVRLCAWVVPSCINKRQKKEARCIIPS